LRFHKLGQIVRLAFFFAVTSFDILLGKDIFLAFLLFDAAVPFLIVLILFLGAGVSPGL
jgi:hypothetical protein